MGEIREKRTVPRRSVLSSFKPVVDRKARVLILGTMPGPVALSRRQYYSFPGNHFWPILQELLGSGGRALSYPQKIRLLRKNRIALWDVIASCRRRGASDSAITCAAPNRVPELLKKHPGIRVVFVNGKTAERLFHLHFGGGTKLPVICLPSTSPAHASMSFREKLRRWRRVKKELAAV
ncbi:MAG: DNA-deoxyinosine glycosylase [Candidatus Omnitrophica bacterium]|nr:DNA-deoxyinosine glycosylase [Candidatus Omnitrophota bacterium]